MTRPAMRPHASATRRHFGARGLALSLAWYGGLATARDEGPAAPGAGAVPDAVRLALSHARLAGAGRLRWFGLPIYDARLFVGGAGLDPARWQAAAFALELRYARRLQGEEIAQASLREMVRMGYGSANQQTRWLSSMRALFPDVAPGDRLTGIHQPEAPVGFLRDDAPIGQVADPGFGAAFFAIWLDPRTVSPDLRRALIAQAADAPVRP